MQFFVPWSLRGIFGPGLVPLAGLVRVTERSEMDINKHPYNACDYRCERCLETDACAVYRKLYREGTLDEFGDGPDGEEVDEFAAGVEESLNEAAMMVRELAQEEGIDTDDLLGDAPWDDDSDNDPLFIDSHAFTLNTHRFIKWADAFIPDEAREYFADITWHHTVVSAKVYRALGSPAEEEYLIEDSRNSAAVAVKSLTICSMAFEYLASRCPAIAKESMGLRAAADGLKDRIRERFQTGRSQN